MASGAADFADIDAATRHLADLIERARLSAADQELFRQPLDAYWRRWRSLACQETQPVRPSVDSDGRLVEAPRMLTCKEVARIYRRSLAWVSQQAGKALPAPIRLTDGTVLFRADAIYTMLGGAETVKRFEQYREDVVRTSKVKAPAR